MARKQTKVDEVYDYLLSEFVNQHFHAGDHLVISSIARQCSTSEIPVREALRQLESDGYIKIDANRGATAIGITRESIRNISQIKGVLEGYATRLAVNYLTPNDIRQLYSINERMHEAALCNDDELYSKMNISFHRSIYQHLPNTDLCNLIEKLWQKWNFTKQVFSIFPVRMNLSYQEHLDILKLIEERKYDEVEICVRRHKISALEGWVDTLPSEPAPSENEE